MNPKNTSLLSLIIIFIALIMCGFPTLAQNIAETHILSNPLPQTSNHHYIARDYIELQEGFGISANNDASFHGEIDPYLIFPPSGGVTGGIYDAVVGNFSGEFTVDNSGAAVYNLPFDLPKGINDMTPNLGLNYNSQRSDGLLGIGWSLSGISAIHRVPYSLHYNQNTSSLLFSHNDQLKIDGKMLIKKTRDNNEVYYITEDYDYGEIVPENGNINNGFTVFKKDGTIWEYGIDGGKHLLQTSTMPIAWYVTKITDNTGNFIRFRYDNNTDYGSIRPASIEYAGNNLKPCVYRISFNYGMESGGRNNYPKKFFYNPGYNEQLFSTLTDYLKEVYIWKSDTAIAKYKMEYYMDFTNGQPNLPYRLYLNRVSEYKKDKDNNYARKNPITFGWTFPKGIIVSTSKEVGTDEHSGGVQDIQLIEVKNRHYAFSDIVSTYRKSLANKYCIRMWRNTLENDCPYKYENGYYFETIFNDGRDILTIAPIDLEGDGIEKILCIINLNSTLYASIGEFNGAGNYTEDLIALQSGSGEQNKRFFIGDYNGDGIDDIAYFFVPSGSTLLQCRIYLGNRGNQPFSEFTTNGHECLVDSPPWPISNLQESGPYILQGNFIGDNKSQFVIIGINTTSFIQLKNNTNGIAIHKITNGLSLFDPDKIFLAGDFNGDGKTDIFRSYPSEEENDWEFFYSNGSGNFSFDPDCYHTLYKSWKYNDILPDNTSDSIFTQSSTPRSNYIAKDCNHDGYYDIIRTKHMEYKKTNQHNYQDSYQVDAYIEQHAIFPLKNVIETKLLDSKRIIGHEYNSPSLNEMTFFLLSGDFIHWNNLPEGIKSGNIAAMLIRKSQANETTKPMIYSIIGNQNSERKLTNYAINQITNSFGKQIKIDYQAYCPVPNNNNPTYSFPLAHYTGNLRTVTSYDMEVAQNQFLTVGIEYTEPRTHLAGKGFLGFKQITQSNELNNTKTIKDFEINEDYFVVEPTSETVRQLGNGKLISQNSNAFGYFTLNDNDSRTFYRYPTEKLEKTYDVSGTLYAVHKTNYSNYDFSCGKPESVTHSFGESLSDYPISETHSFEFISAQSGFMLGLPTKHDITNSKTGENDVTTEKNMSYYESGQLEWEKLQPGTSNELKTKLEYDDFGNITKKTLITPQNGSRITNYSYSDDGRFLLSETNMLGHQLQYRYYTLNGLLRKSIDPNGLETNFYYDNLWRLQKTIYPDGREEQTHYRWAEGNGYAPDNASYYIWKQTSGESWSMEFFDKFNQSIRNVAQIALENTVATDQNWKTNSGKAGLLHQTSNPYFISSGGSGNNDLSFTEYTYNSVRQPNTVTLPDGQEKSYTYSGNTVTINGFDGQTSEKNYNAAGWLTSVKDNDVLETTFSHYADGLVKEVMTNTGTPSVKTEYNYDAYRRLSSKTEQNSGTHAYVNTPFGELDYETKPGYQIDYEYDQIGRLIESTTTDGTTVWVYDNKDHGIGLVGTETYTPTTGKTVVYDYTFDMYGRTLSEKQAVDQNDWFFKYAYNEFGRMKAITYPSGIRIRHKYDRNSFLKTITTADNQPLWKLDEVNANNDITRYTMGDAIAVWSIFDEENYRITDIKTGLKGSSNNSSLQNLHYAWYDNGDLEIRADLNKSLSETFTYDGFNQLLTSTLNSNQQLDMDYDVIGNIKKITGSETQMLYGQNNAGPCALTTISPTPDKYKGLQQTAGFNSFDKIASLLEYEETSGGLITNKYERTVGYDSRQQGVLDNFTDHTNNTSRATRSFNGLFKEEVTGATSIKHHYLHAPTGIFATFESTSGGNIDMNYYLKDHLGSIVSVADGQGNLLQELNYDAWGKRRDANTWAHSNTLPAPNTPYGFTGHEHWDNFALINMKGRLYDPVVGRFLSPDPVVQNTEYGPNYNPYSYCLNNPLKYIDPSGFNYDWYQNVLTGDMYYNSTYKGESDVEKIDGEGWEYFGPDGMFGKSEWDLAREYNLPSDTPPLTNGLGFNVEISLKGDKAEGFMQEMGYEFKQLESFDKITHQITANQLIPAGGSIYHENQRGIRVVTKSGYVDNSFIAKSNIQSLFQVDDPVNTWTGYTKRTFNYEKPYALHILGATFKLGNFLYSTWGGSFSHSTPDIQVVNGWENYKGNDRILLKYKKDK